MNKRDGHDVHDLVLDVLRVVALPGQEVHLSNDTERGGGEYSLFLAFEI